MSYSVVVVDPPWPVRKIVRRVRPNQKAELDYKTMSLDEIKSMPIREVSAENSVLFLWTTHAYLEAAFDVMRSWDFKYQRTLTWDKGNGMCLFGFHHRTEFVLFGYRGKIEMYPHRKAIPTVFSGKPHQIFKSLPNSNKGDVGEEFIRRYAEELGFTVVKTQRLGDWDLTIQGKKFEIKLATEDVSGAFLKRTCSVLGDADKGGRLLLQWIYVKQLPIYKVNFDNPAEKSIHSEVVALVEKILVLQKQRQAVRPEDNLDHVRNLDRQIKDINSEIDKRVYKLYGLTDEEIKIVEGSL